MPVDNKQYLLNLLTPSIRTIASEEANILLPAGTVYNINLGLGLTASQIPITSTATLSINAGLSDLNDVNTSDLVYDQILTWSGTCWSNVSFPGLSGTSFRFVDLLDVDISSLGSYPDNIISVNSDGNALISIENNYVDTINSGQGINAATSVDNHTVLVSFDPGTLLTNTDVGENDYIITQRSGYPKRIKFSNTDISLFNNDSEFLPRSQLTAGLGISIIDTGTLISIGISLGEIPVSFNATGGVCGVLQLINGGTSSTTAEGARTNLGLEYNVDILSQSGPSFRGDMFGNNIILLPSVFNFTLSQGGTLYNTGVSFETRYLDDIFIPTETLITGPGGAVTGPTYFTLSNQTGISHFDYSQDYNVLPLVGTFGVNATYTVEPENFYLLFGGRYGTCLQDGIGFRDNEGSIEVKSTRTGEGSCWQQIFPLSIGGLCDITINNPTDNEILIYNGTSFINSTLSGPADYAVLLNTVGGVTTLNIDYYDNTIDVSKLDSTVTQTELNYVSGVTSSIQTQLDDKIGDTGYTTGDLIYNNGSNWTALRPNTNLHQMVTISTVQQIPSWGYLYDVTTGTAPGLSWVSDDFIFMTDGTSPAFRTTMPDYLDGGRLCEADGGIEFTTPGKKIQINIDNLTNRTSFGSSVNDEIAFYNSVLLETDKMSMENFAINLVNDGLTANGGRIDIGVSIPLVLKEFSSIANLTSYNPVTYRNHLAGVSANYAGTSLVYSDGISWYYVNMGSVIV